MYELYNKAKELLHQQYQQNYEIVKSSDFHRAYVNEKIRHSLQVSGAGNGILRNEAYFKNRSPEFLDIARTAIILHDIFRFNEVKRWFLTGEKSDHGVEGAAMLKTIPTFNDIHITLSIKHHGHMVEKFYEDPEYTQINDSNLQKDIEHIHFAVRDADKIANWQILTKEFEAMRLVWLPFPTDNSSSQGIICEKMWKNFCNEEVVSKEHIQTNADELLSVLCWLFDINYEYSIKYCQRLNIFKCFFQLFEIIGTNKEQCRQIENIVSNYILKKFNIKI